MCCKHEKQEEINVKEYVQLTDRKDSSEDGCRVAGGTAIPSTHAKLMLTFVDSHLCSDT